MRLNRFLRHLTASSTVTGTVIAVSPTAITVATPSGRQSASRRGDATNYVIGQRITIQEGRIVGVVGATNGRRVVI